MTTLTAATLTESQQMLVDARLDTIDRMLMGHIPRTDRMAIVSEVEAQIQELLAAKDHHEISREDVLEVLRTLDPPEAYLTDELSGETPPRSRRTASRATNSVQGIKPSAKQYGWLGGILGLSSLGVILLFPLAHIAAVMMESELLLILGFVFSGLLGLAGSISGLVLSIQGRRQGALPILGIIGGGISLPLCMLGFLFTAYIFMNLT